MNTRLLLDGLDELGIPASENQIRQIESYIGEFERWNRRMNLVKATGDAFIVRHVLDSLSGVPTVQWLGGDNLLDAGSGAGLPGVPLAVFLSGREVTLLDRSAKRAAFLKSAVAVVPLENCRVSETELDRDEGLYDIVCCRAFRPLKISFPGLVRRLAPGGTLVLYKGKRAIIDEELRAVDEESTGYERRIVPVSVPFLEEERHLLLFRDTSL